MAGVACSARGGRCAFPGCRILPTVRAPLTSPDDRAVLPTRGRAVRALALLLGAGLLLLGTARGSDDHFPFGPFLMYAGAGPTDGTVADTRLVALTTEGERVRVPEDVSGMRRAELEGQLQRFVAEPGLLAAVAQAQARAHPDDPAYVRVAIVQRRHEVRDRRVAGRTDVELAGWAAP